MLNKLQELRIQNKYSYQKIATEIGVSKPFYWQIENGKRRLSYIMAIKISKIFKMKTDELFYDDFKNMI